MIYWKCYVDWIKWQGENHKQFDILLSLQSPVNGNDLTSFLSVLTIPGIPLSFPSKCVCNSFNVIYVSRLNCSSDVTGETASQRKLKVRRSVY